MGGGGRHVAPAKVLRALTARFLFAAHGLLCIWRVASIYDDSIFWLLGLVLVLIFIEGGLVIFYRQANESRWFCTSVFLYLCAVAPSLWFLQLELSRTSIRDAARNASTLIATTTITEIREPGEAATFDFVGYKVTIFIPLEREVWVQLLQQTMLVTLILGRWILPKGDISRDHLSQLLLVFLAMAADMVELFDTFKENQVKFNLRLTCLVLAVWTISIVQFPLVLTGRSSRKQRHGSASRYSSIPLQNMSRSSRSSSLHQMDHIYSSIGQPSFCQLITKDINFWGIMTCTFLQDGPFLGTRLYLLIAHQTISYTMIFFTCKNILVVALQFYRLFVICTETSKLVEGAKEANTTGVSRNNSNAMRMMIESNLQEEMSNGLQLIATPGAVFIDNGDGKANPIASMKASSSDTALLYPPQRPWNKKHSTRSNKPTSPALGVYVDELDTSSLRDL